MKGGVITDERREGGSQRRCFSMQLLPNTHTLPVGVRAPCERRPSALVPHQGEERVSPSSNY